MELPINDVYNLKKGDLIIIAVILCVTGVAALLIMHQKKGDLVSIISGENEEIYYLNEDRTVKVVCESGGYNIVVIKDGRAWVEEADCINQICVGHRPIYKDHESIVCIPHKLIVEIKSSEKNEIDN